MADSYYPDDNQLAGLVQAATAAADEHAQDSTAPGKRKRDDIEHDPSLEVDAAINDTLINDAPDPGAIFNSTPQLQNSASVLFREPSSRSKKHGRPPLGNVFASLELAPERFLRLQSAAKDFMLDAAHPERRDVVGHKKNSGGSDLAKLNLWNCIEEFLFVHGYGEQYFAPGAGDSIPGAPHRTLIWPQESQAIIKLMMPLMRKMVTNERQRIYAAATRNQGPARDTSAEQSPAAVDESLISDHRASEAGRPVEEIEVPPTMPAQQHVPALSPTGAQSTTMFKPSIFLYVNIVSNSGGSMRRVIPRFTLTPEAAPNLSSLLNEVEKRYPLASTNGSASGAQTRPLVKVWLTDGLVDVAEDGDYMVALLSASVVDWMDNEIRILVQV